MVEILRSTADWYEAIVDPKDLDQHDVTEEWGDRNYLLREFYLLIVDNEPVGTISVQDAGDALYLGYVYLHVDAVGRGLGRKLLDFAVGEGRRRNKRSLVLISHPEAEWAVRAYEKYGFQVLAERREDIVEWNDGWLESYYEEGFHLFEYRL